VVLNFKFTSGEDGAVVVGRDDDFAMDEVMMAAMRVYPPNTDTVRRG